MRYFVKSVVCDYGIYRLDGEKRKLIEICNSRSNAEMVAEILNSDDKHEVWGRPQGEWIIDGHHYKCSRCGKTLAIMFSETDNDDLIGCPFCLADMKGGAE